MGTTISFHGICHLERGQTILQRNMVTQVCLTSELLECRRYSKQSLLHIIIIVFMRNAGVVHMTMYGHTTVHVHVVHKGWILSLRGLLWDLPRTVILLILHHMHNIR